MAPYLTIKSLHIIFVITWFAGLFYLPRLFIYSTEAQEKVNPNEKDYLQNQFKVMQTRLWYGITWPSCILSLMTGTLLLKSWLPLSDNIWLICKLVMVLLLFLYHLSLGHINKNIQQHNYHWSSIQLRFWNEVPTILLFGIIFLVIFKDVIAIPYSLAALATLMAILIFSIKVYNKIRKLKS